MSDEKYGTRPYRKRQRAAAEARTRERITEAAVRLHGTVGPAQTTVSGIAREAGVQRATVYRHFPDEAGLFEACTAHYFASHPMPRPDSWGAIADPAERAVAALRDLYRWFRRTEAMLERTSRDAGVVEAMAGPVAAFRGYLEAVTEAIIRGRRERGAARRRVAAATGHAVSFGTWQSLAGEQGLDDDQAVALMAAMIEAAGRATSRPARG
ncbi:MAG: TetR/AcrR family transcriptional regulator [Actinomycetota bacterium]|nr:TetR/AcrR family transcriptional regulator [Actinomycetota bacterium]